MKKEKNGQIYASSQRITIVVVQFRAQISLTRVWE